LRIVRADFRILSLALSWVFLTTHNQFVEPRHYVYEVRAVLAGWRT